MDLLVQAPDFTLDMDRLEVQKYLNKQFGYGYSSTRHRFRKKYQKYDNMEEAKAHVPKNVSQEAWHDMCESFADKKWKEKSKRDIVNRSKLNVNHTTGSKSFIRCRNELGIQNEGETIGPVTFYKISHTKKDGSFVTSATEENYNNMQDLLS